MSEHAAAAESDREGADDDREIPHVVPALS